VRKEKRNEIKRERKRRNEGKREEGEKKISRRMKEI